MAHDRCPHHSRPSPRRRRKRGQQTQAFGRCRGGFPTKLQAVCDALGNPLRFIVTGGKRHDSTQAQTLLDGFQAQAVLADKSYDADELGHWVQQTGARVVIPPRSNRTVLRDYDKVLHKERNLVERMFGDLKHFRRVATRYDKTALSFLSFVQLAAPTYGSSNCRQTLMPVDRKVDRPHHLVVWNERR